MYQRDRAGITTGEVGAGKTVAPRAALAALDASRRTFSYLPNPAVGARGLYAALVSGHGGIPRCHTARDGIAAAADAAAGG